MISSKYLKEEVKKERKKISKKAGERIEMLLKKRVKELLKTAKRNADFAGRRVIKEQDIEENENTIDYFH